MAASTVLEETSQTPQEKLKAFFASQEAHILTFTREKRLIIEIAENEEEFVLDPQTYTLYVPLKLFEEEDIDAQMVLFSVYETLAQYWDWKEHPQAYLKRMEKFRVEIEHLVLIFQKKLALEGLLEKEEYSTAKLYEEASSLVGIVLVSMDHLYRYLRVLQLCPIYNQESYQKKIQAYYDQNHYSFRYLTDEKAYEKRMDALVCASVFGIEACKELGLLQFLKKPHFKTPYYEYIQKELTRMIRKGQGIEELDYLIQTSVLPEMMKLFEEEILDLNLVEDTKKQDQQDGSGGGSYQKKAKLKQGLDQKNQNDLLEQMEIDQKGNQTAKEDIRKGYIDLAKYKVDENDQQLYHKYERIIDPQRHAMKEFWRALIGDAKKEEPFKRPYEPKGKLNVQSIIDTYPDFLEDSRRGNFKDVKIFDRYFLKPQARKLPQKIDITFVIDNSGSMEDFKIDMERQALLLTMLSLEDFDQYLKYNAAVLKQRIEVNTEVFYFGTGHTILKKFEDKLDPQKELAAKVSSIVRLDGKQGSTDDGGCLQAILRRMDKDEKYEIATGKRIRLIFEITDGASSFPKVTKDAVASIQEIGAEIFAFKIGKQEEEEEEIFRSIFIEDQNPPLGMVVNDRLDQLPTLLLKTAGQKLKNIFKK